MSELELAELRAALGVSDGVAWKDLVGLASYYRGQAQMTADLRREVGMMSVMCTQLRAELERIERLVDPAEPRPFALREQVEALVQAGDVRGARKALADAPEVDVGSWRRLLEPPAATTSPASGSAGFRDGDVDGRGFDPR